MVDPMVHLWGIQRHRENERIKADRLSENAVEAAIARWMLKRGWRRTRNHVGTFYTKTGSPIQMSQEGFPDWTYNRGQSISHVEAKAAGKRPTPKQREVIASLNLLGEWAWWADSLDSHIWVYSKYWSPLIDEPYLANR